MRNAKRKSIVTSRHRGTMQKDRALPALDPGYVQVDEQSLADKLNFIYRFSSQVKLVDANNSDYGEWQWMLQNDQTFALASIAGVQLDGYTKGFNRAQKLFSNGLSLDDQEQSVADLFLYVTRLAYNLADWSLRIQLVPSDPLGLVSKLVGIMTANLGNRLAYLPNCLNSLTFQLNPTLSERTGQEFYAQVSAIMTQLRPLLNLPSTEDLPALPLGTLEQCFGYLKLIYRDLYRCNREAQQQLAKLLQATLNLPNHTPHATLLHTFTQQMNYASEAINTLTQRHLDFYYRKVLRLSPNPPQPDHVNVAFTLKKGILASRVPAGTQLVAGKGAAGEEIIYATDKDLFPNVIEVGSVKSVYNAGANAAVLGEGQLFMAPVANSADGLGGKFPSGSEAQWPAFGTDDPVAGGAKLPLAEVGMGISHPIFGMSMGTRSVSGYFILDSTSAENLTSQLEVLANGTENVADTFQRTLGKSLLASYTGPKGWETLPQTAGLSLFSPDFPSNDTDIPSGATGFLFQASLDASQPAWDVWNLKTHGPGFAAGLPALKLMVDQSQVSEWTLGKGDLAKMVEISPYNLLRNLVFDQIEWNVSVQGKTDIALQNEFSVLDATKVFQPFGPTAELNSSLLIGSSEVFRKELTALSLGLSWVKLPVDDNGFSDYYAVWNEMLTGSPFHNAAFRASLSIRQSRNWVLLPPKPRPKKMDTPQDYPLFRWKPAPPGSSAGTANPEQWLTLNLNPASPQTAAEIASDSLQDGKLLAEISFDHLDLSGITAAITEIPAGPEPVSFPFNETVSTGFLRLSLTSPEYGFGQPVYTEVANAVNAANITTITDAAKSTSTSQKLSKVASLVNQKKTVDAINKLATPTTSTTDSGTDANTDTPTDTNVDGSTSDSAKTAPAKIPNPKAILGAIVNSQPPATDILPTPNPPFIPQAKGLTLNYSAKATITAASGTGFQTFQIQPFGVIPSQSPSGIPFIPNFSAEGTFYLGLAKVQAPQTFNLWFQVNENSADNSVSSHAMVSWSYLKKGDWTAFTKSQVVQDGTEDFSRTGIIEWTLESGAEDTAGWFSSEADHTSLLWLRATINKGTAATCQVLDLIPQAIQATYVVGPSANSHLAVPLAGGTITKMAAPLPDIAKVLQPYSGFGGRQGESDNAFYIRVMERLRHKQRLVTQWDIERLTLQLFPEVGLANAFLHTRLRKKAPEYAPGNTLLVVFPANKLSGLANPFTPQFPLSELLAISETLDALKPEGMNLAVANPDYDTVLVRASVNFGEGMDPGFYLKQLNADLNNYLSPWAAEPSQFNPYDTLVSPALIRGFINGLSYIEGIVELQVFQYFDRDGSPVFLPQTDDHTYLEPHVPWSILTSAPQHLLGDAQGAPPLGLGFVIVEEPAQQSLPASIPSSEAPAANEQEYLLIEWME